jgi:hypothetical protein
MQNQQIFEDELSVSPGRSVCLTHVHIFGNSGNGIDKPECFNEDALVDSSRSGTTMRQA